MRQQHQQCCHWSHRWVPLSSLVVLLSWITEAIKDKHQAIFHLLNSQIGHQIQKTESDIIIKALLTAMKEDISCLPVHDALLFPKSKKKQGIRIMSHAYREITGSEGAIKEE